MQCLLLQKSDLEYKEYSHFVTKGKLDLRCGVVINVLLANALRTAHAFGFIMLLMF